MDAFEVFLLVIGAWIVGMILLVWGNYRFHEFIREKKKYLFITRPRQGGATDRSKMKLQ